jgi:ribosomal protein L18
LKIVSKSDVGQVEDNSNGEYARKVLEDENVEKDEMDAKNVGECDYLESRESSNRKCLDFEGEEKEIENGDDTIDNEVDAAITNVKENISNNGGDDDKEITENGCEDLSSSDDNINDNKNLDNSDNERQGKLIDNENDFGKNNDEENEESCNESRTINNDKNALLESENISLVVSEILENILAQIVGEEPTEDLDNLSVIKNDLKDSGSSGRQLELKTNEDLAIDVVDEHLNVNSNRTCADKKANLAKIESFDLELEFCNLEDDMFDSESSEDEAGHDKEGSDNDLNRDTPSTLSIEPNSSMEIPSSTLEDTENSVEPEENENQQCYGKSDEEQGDDASMGADLNKDPAESIRRNGEGESLNAKDIDDKKDSIGPEVSPVVDLEVARKQLNEIFVDMRFFLGEE